jgi:hypothetical protein
MRDPCRPIRYTSRPPVTPSPTFPLLSSILEHEWRRFTSDYHHRRCLSFPFLAPIKWTWAPLSRPPLHLQSPASPPSLAPKSPHYPEAIATTDLSFPSLPTHQRPLEWVPRISPCSQSPRSKAWWAAMPSRPNVYEIVCATATTGPRRTAPCPVHRVVDSVHANFCKKNKYEQTSFSPFFRKTLKLFENQPTTPNFLDSLFTLSSKN